MCFDGEDYRNTPTQGVAAARKPQHIPIRLGLVSALEALDQILIFRACVAHSAGLADGQGHG